MRTSHRAIAAAAFLAAASTASAQKLFGVGAIGREAEHFAKHARALAEARKAARPVSAKATPPLPSSPTELRSSEVPPVSISKTVQRLSPEEQMRLITAINDDLRSLDEELHARLAMEPRTKEIEADISGLNDAITAKRQALELARAAETRVSNAGAESFAAVSNPYFLICGDMLWARSDPLKWEDQIVKIKDRLLAVGRSVGMIELDKRHIGTGFVVGDKYVVTNLHVVREIADFNEKTRRWSVRTGATISFDVEYALGTELKCDKPPRPKRTYYVTAVHSVPKEGQGDVAVLMTSRDNGYPAPLEVKTRPNASYKAKMIVAVLGYPGPPRDMTIAEQISFFTGPDTQAPQFVYKRVSGGYTGDELVTTDGMFVHKANTAGGNSGSPVIDLADGSVVGIHVEGRDRYNDVMGYNRGLTGEHVRALLVKAGLAK